MAASRSATKLELPSQDSQPAIRWIVVEREVSGNASKGKLKKTAA